MSSGRISKLNNISLITKGHHVHLLFQFIFKNCHSKKSPAIVKNCHQNRRQNHHQNLSLKFVVKICRQNLSPKFVAKICRQNLSSKFVIKICRQNLSSKVITLAPVSNVHVLVFIVFVIFGDGYITVIACWVPVRDNGGEGYFGSFYGKARHHLLAHKRYPCMEKDHVKAEVYKTCL